MSKFKKTVALLSLSVALNVWSQSPITEIAPETSWSESNKATLLRGEVTLENKLLFKIEREGNIAYIKLPKNPSVLQRGMWKFEIVHEGQSSYAQWDKKKAAWKAHIKDNGTYTIYVSKRKNNKESLPHSWFLINN